MCVTLVEVAELFNSFSLFFPLHFHPLLASAQLNDFDPRRSMLHYLPRLFPRDLLSPLIPYAPFLVWGFALRDDERRAAHGVHSW
jgi:hypothetical protein